MFQREWENGVGMFSVTWSNENTHKFGWNRDGVSFWAEKLKYLWNELGNV